MPRTRRVRFAVDTYTIPPLPSCSDVTSIPRSKRSISKTAPPVPSGWSIAFAPNELVLAPGEEGSVTATITPPPGFSGRMSFNVTSRDEYRPIGGVTLIVEAP